MRRRERRRERYLTGREVAMEGGRETEIDPSERRSINECNCTWKSHLVMGGCPPPLSARAESQFVYSLYGTRVLGTYTVFNPYVMSILNPSASHLLPQPVWVPGTWRY